MDQPDVRQDKLFLQAGRKNVFFKFQRYNNSSKRVKGFFNNTQICVEIIYTQICDFMGCNESWNGQNGTKKKKALVVVYFWLGCHVKGR